MTNDQLILLVGGFIIANAATIFAVVKWGVSRAIQYTHLERDVLELQKYRDLNDVKYERIQIDLKGLSIKINGLKETLKK